MSEEDFDDELIENDGANPNNLSDEEIAKRLEVFSKRVKKNIAIMMSPKKFRLDQRVKATQWLGEAGEPTAIPYLIKAYEKDKSNAVKKAAKESLGQLKALGEMLIDDDPEIQQIAMDLSQGIVLNGEFGSRSRFPRRILRLLMFGLFSSATVIFVVAMLIPPRSEDPSLVPLEVQLTRTAVALAQTPSATPTESDNPAESLERLRVYYSDLDNDSRLLQTQMLSITRNQPQDCSLVFANRSAYSLPQSLSGLTELAPVVIDLNAAQTTIQTVYNRFKESCDTQQPVPRQEAIDLSGTLVEAQRTLGNVPAVLLSLGITVPPTATPAIVATNTPLPSETPTPTNTPNANRINSQVLAIQALIDEMNGTRGKNTLLVEYWQLYQDFNSRDGCLQLPLPPIAGNFVLPENVASEAPAELQLATDNLNLGLGLARRSAAAFESACNTNTLGENVVTQLPEARNAETAFDNAQSQLDIVKASIGR